MKLEDFAYAILDQCEELQELRRRNAYLEEQLHNYDRHMSEYNSNTNAMFGKILDIALDPESHINKQMRDKQ